MMKFGQMLKANIMHDTAERPSAWGRRWDGAYSNQSGWAQSNGIARGTQIATQLGWRAVETLQVNDRVLTFDNGMKKITRIERTELVADLNVPLHLLPLFVPAGAIGNSVDMTLLPEQVVMIESDLGEKVYGDAFTSMPAAALNGYKGIERQVVREPIEIFVLYFEKEQVIFADDGALLHCASQSSTTVSGLLDEILDYTVLPMRDAVKFVAQLEVGSDAQVVWMGPDAAVLDASALDAMFERAAA